MISPQGRIALQLAVTSAPIVARTPMTEADVLCTEMSTNPKSRKAIT